jgi:hypothetical protein
MFDSSTLVGNQGPFTLMCGGDAVIEVRTQLAYCRETETWKPTGRWSWCAGLLEEEPEMMVEAASRQEAIVAASQWLHTRAQAEIARLQEIERDTAAILEVLA